MNYILNFVATSLFLLATQSVYSFEAGISCKNYTARDIEIANGTITPADDETVIEKPFWMEMQVFESRKSAFLKGNFSDPEYPTNSKSIHIVNYKSVNLPLYNEWHDGENSEDYQLSFYDTLRDYILKVPTSERPKFKPNSQDWIDGIAIKFIFFDDKKTSYIAKLTTKDNRVFTFGWIKGVSSLPYCSSN